MLSLSPSHTLHPNSGLQQKLSYTQSWKACDIFFTSMFSHCHFRDACYGDWLLANVC